MSETVEQLAEYFTGPAVAHNSICLAMPSPHNTMAKLFFDIRSNLGINGYDDKEEAIAAISQKLST